MFVPDRMPIHIEAVKSPINLAPEAMNRRFRGETLKQAVQRWFHSQSFLKSDEVDRI